MKISNHQLVADPTEAFEITQIELKSWPTRGIERVDTIVIRGTGTPSALSAKNVYMNGTNRAHLLIGQDGHELIQMTDFNRRVGSGFAFETTCLIIGLVNVGYLLTDASQRSSFRHRDNFSDDQMLWARASNDRKQRWWPYYPEAQLDALMEVLAALGNHYPIKHVRSYEELYPQALDPGPTLPLVNLIEQVHRRIPGLQTKLQILNTVTESVTLRSEPRANAHTYFNGQVAPQTAAAIVEEREDWSLVEVIDAQVQGQWRKGWVNRESLRLQDFTPVVVDDMLETSEGRAFPFIPAARGNFDANPKSNKPRYLIMHYTTGTQIQSTINHFRNPGSGVSTHLVIGRDGRIFQMVPFNHAAYHAGFSFWEGESNLNRASIGIELDNAGRLSEVNGRFFKRDHEIPSQRAIEAKHWKSRIRMHFEDFSAEQIQVARLVARALIEHYDLKDILGHDEVNLKTRYDPGPLFPMAEWRDTFFQRTGPDIKPNVARAGANIYLDFEGFEGVPPKLRHPLIKAVQLKEGQIIQIISETEPYTLIKFRKGDRPFIGWVESKFVRRHTEKPAIMKSNIDFFEKLPKGAPPPTVHRISPLSAPMPVRIEKTEGDLALVVSTREVDGIPYVEGWVQLEEIETSEG